MKHNGEDQGAENEMKESGYLQSATWIHSQVAATMV